MQKKQGRVNDAIWEGVYKDFSETKSGGNAFNSPIWVDKSVDVLKQIYHSGMSKYSEASILFKTISSPIFFQKKKIRILDFGGGVGLTYANLFNGGCKRNLEYHIVENAEVCKAGSGFYKSRKASISFHSSLPSLSRVDIVYIESSLQYVENWIKLLRTLCQYKPLFFIFVDMPAGQIPSFATVQHFYNFRIPYRFFNLGEIEMLMTKQGYVLKEKSEFIAKILGKEQPLPMGNFPEKYRIKHSVNLLYKNSF